MITHEAQQKGAEALKKKADQRARMILDWVAKGWTHEVIADELDINLSSVRTVLHRARRRLGRTVRPRPVLPPLSPDQQAGEYYVDPDARDAYEPTEGAGCSCP